MADHDQPCDDCGDTETEICPCCWLCADCAPGSCGDWCAWGEQR